MANNRIQLKRSTTTTNVPAAASLSQGELAINLTDRRLFTKDGTNAVIDVFGQSLNTTAVVQFANTTSSYANVTTKLTAANVALGNTTITGFANVSGSITGAGITTTDVALINVNSSSDALHITQTGTGNALVIEDEAGDTSPVVVDTDGRLVLGHTATVPIFSNNQSVQAIRSSGYAFVGSRFDNTENPAVWLTSKSRSTTIGGNAILANNDQIGAFFFAGADGNTYVAAATFRAEVDGTPALNSMPGRMVILTTPSGGTTPIERIRVTSGGNTGFNNTAPAHTISVGGSGYFSSSVNVATTFAAGNTTITGFANVSTSVNSAILSVGTAFVANATTVYHNGTAGVGTSTVYGSMTVANNNDTIVATSASPRIYLAPSTANHKFRIAAQDTYNNIFELSYSTTAVTGDPTALTYTPLLTAAANGGIGVRTTPISNAYAITTAPGYNLSFGVPADCWSRAGIAPEGGATGTFGNAGLLYSHGAYRTSWSCNGYRNQSNLWTSLGINTTTGAAMIQQDPTGYISFHTDANKATGSSVTVTERLRVTATGNTGINNTAPVHLLSVNGDAYFGSSVNVATTFAAGNTTIAGFANIQGDAVITGNLTVSGTTTYINTTALDIGDNIIVLNADLPGASAPTENAGFTVNRGSSTDVTFQWDETNDRWALDQNTYINGNANATTFSVGASLLANSSGIYPGSNTVGTAIGSTTARPIIVANSATMSGGLYPVSNTVGQALGSATQQWTLIANNGSFSGQIVSTDSYDAGTNGGNIYLNGPTGNRIDWSTVGIAAPAVTTRSAGTKLVLYPQVNATSVDYGLGIESNHMWFSAGQTTNGFKFYCNTSVIMTANTTGITMANNNIDNVVLKRYGEASSAPTISAGALTLNIANGTVFNVNLNANITTLTLSGAFASGTTTSFTLIFNGDGTARSVTWPASVRWAYGTAPTLTSTLNKKDVFTFLTTDGGTTWLAVISGQNF